MTHARKQASKQASHIGAKDRQTHRLEGHVPLLAEHHLRRGSLLSCSLLEY